MKKIFYFSATHRDREWYQSFQGFRMKSVDDLTAIIEYLGERSDFGVFHMDGQTVIFDDYAEIVPENTQKLKELISNGRITIGPWYTMPDEYTVSGEGLIRNLCLGHKKSRQWDGKPWQVGYICDIFGHTAQMPQIFSLFGIKTAVLGRGTNDCDFDVVFNWQAPNGSTCLTYRVPEEAGYGSFYLEVLYDGHGGCISPDSEEFERRLKTYLDREIERSNTGCVVVFDGGDHRPLHELTPVYLTKIRELYPDYEVEHVNLEEAFRCLEGGKYKTVCGELNSTARDEARYLHLITNTLSSRYSLKKKNDECEYMLTMLAEPMQVALGDACPAYTSRYIDNAWEWLLKNHAHDSICGCSIDRVHDDMVYRFSQVEGIVEACVDKTVRNIVGELLPIGKEGGYVNVFNPLPYSDERELAVEVPLALDFPKYREPFGFEDICAFRIFDEGGKEIKYAISHVNKHFPVRKWGESMAVAECVTVRFKARLNPLGITSFRIEPQNVPVRFYGGMADADGTIDNGRVRLEVTAEGVNLTDLATGNVYKNCLGFVDDGEIGDGWYSVRPCVGGRSVYRPVQTRIESDGPAYACVRVTFSANVPSGLTETVKGYREQPFTEQEIEVLFSLYDGSDSVGVTVRLNNKVKDHRIRLVLKTREKGDYFANEAFCFVDRECGLDRGKESWAEADCIEKACDGIVGRAWADGGLAIINDYGVKECAGTENGDIYLTLLRGFSRTHGTAGEMGGQELGEKEYQFRLVPLEGKPLYGLQRRQDVMRAKAVSFPSAQSNQSASFEIKGACVSCVKSVDGGTLVRVYNPTPNVSAFSVDGYEGAVRECDVTGKNDVKAHLRLAPFEIKNLLLKNKRI